MSDLLHQTRRDFLFFIIFVCTFRSLVLFCFLINAVYVVIVFRIERRCLRSRFFNSVVHFSLKFVVLDDDISSREDEEKKN